MYIGCVNSVVNHNFTLLERTCYCSVYTAYVHIWTYLPLITYVILPRWYVSFSVHMHKKWKQRTLIALTIMVPQM